MHHWCQHLLRDCVYEGRGGRKFVRIQPGSILQLLYPCSRYSPDRCLICGGSFQDHIDLWWGKHRYRPYDRLTDAILESGPAFHRSYLQEYVKEDTRKRGRRQQPESDPNRMLITFPGTDLLFQVPRLPKGAAITYRMARALVLGTVGSLVQREQALNVTAAAEFVVPFLD